MKDFAVLQQFENLTWLYLDHSNANDTLAKNLASLSKLKYLNLVGTTISDQTLSTLGKMTGLKHIYLYQTQVTPGGISNLLELVPDVKLDTGKYELPALATDTVTYRKKTL
jgi:hypothetical protein